jgi:1,4-dihydroxy-2-naphthoyl-CoA hydrolase
MSLRPLTIEDLNRRRADTLVAHLAITFTHLAQGELSAEMPVTPQVMAANGYLHAGSVVALADTCAGFGCIAHLPATANNFTTVELKTNFLGTARDGRVTCTARLMHAGRTTQVWDATVSHQETGKTIALFRCTQLLLYPSA